MGTNFTSIAYMSLDSDKSPSLHIPLSTSTSSVPTSTNFCTFSLAPNHTPHTHFDSLHRSLLIPLDSTKSEQVSVFAAKKKYKPVALKTRPLLANLPDKFQIVRNITGDPLTNIPILTPTPPPFAPTGRYTTKHRDRIDKVHSGDFLWPADVMMVVCLG
jgi:hypothetical protein